MNIIIPILLNIFMHGSENYQWSDNFSINPVYNDKPEMADIVYKEMSDTGVKYGNLIDPRDGKTYRTINIGQQVWMAENLNYDAGEGCWIYDNNPEYGMAYGRLYNWEVAVESCPAGWHLPGGGEWLYLRDYLGGNDLAGGKMKATGNDFWKYPNVVNKDISGFSALPGGFHDINGTFRFAQYACLFWSAKVVNDYYAYFVIMFFNNDFFDDHGFSDKNVGYSVRCVKD